MVVEIPRGVEVLVKKAAVDPKFKKLLLGKRAEAAEAIALKLEPAEEAMLAAVPEDQLRAIVANTKVSPGLRPAFLGYAAAAMLAALGTTTTGCTEAPNEPRGAKPESDRISDAKIGNMRKIRLPTSGIQPDRPETYREGSAVYVGGDAAGVETRRLGDIEYRLRRLFDYVEDEYDDRVKNEPNKRRGNLLIKFTITADGAVESPEIISDNIGFLELTSKTLQLLKAWRFAPVKEGSATVVYLFRLNLTAGPSTGIISSLPLLEKAFNESNATDEIISFEPRENSGEALSALIHERYVPRPAGLTGIRPDAVTKRKHTSPRLEPSVSISEPGITGFSKDNPLRSPKALTRIILKHLGNINNIYVNLIKRNPGLGSGKVVVRYEINADGGVSRAAVISDTMNSAALASAVLSEISRWEFSRVDEGTVTVVQPFVFMDGDN
jgi:outer membrane biosynthesis protein TonB